jgi:hypothetical protein
MKRKKSSISFETDSKRKLDCCMVAAESFCGIEQMTTRVNRWQLLLTPDMASRQHKRVMTREDNE